MHAQSIGPTSQRLQYLEEDRAVQIIESLWFSELPDRRNAIAPAHAETFEWVFTQPDSKLREWLLSGTGLFWVCGKAGSGKSTFMKFMCSHPQTHRALRTWAARSELVVVDFYFWYAGSPIQKSIQGLLQSILHEILQQYPGLVREACPARWESTADGGRLHTNPWTEPELFTVLRTVLDADWSNIPRSARAGRWADSHLAQFLNDDPHRVCFFIDAQALLLAERIIDEQTGIEDNSASFLSYWLLRLEDHGLGLPLMPQHQTSKLQLDGILSDTRRSLSACCKDLIYLDASANFCTHSFADCMQRTKVQLLHRTVYDFLKTDRVARLTDKHRHPSFHDADYLQRLALGRWKKMTTFSELESSDLRPYFLSEVSYACHALEKPELPDHARLSLMHAVDEISQTCLREGHLNNVGCQNYSRDYESGLQAYSAHIHRSLAAYHMPLYLPECLERPHGRFLHDVRDLSNTGLLAALLGYSSLLPFSRQQVDVTLLRSLLQRTVQGVKKPSYFDDWLWLRPLCGPWTLWQLFLANWLATRRKTAGCGGLLLGIVEPYSTEAYDLAKFLLDNGGDAEAVVATQDGERMDVKHAMRECLPRECRADIAETLARHKTPMAATQEAGPHHSST